MIIKKKVDRISFEEIKSGKKRFELRLNEFDIKEGDTLVLEEKDPNTNKLTGRKLSKKVTYVLRFPLDKHGQKEEIIKNGMLVIQF